MAFFTEEGPSAIHPISSRTSFIGRPPGLRGWFAVSGGGCGWQEAIGPAVFPETPFISGGSSDNGVFDRGGSVLHPADLLQNLPYRATPRT